MMVFGWLVLSRLSRGRELKVVVLKQSGVVYYGTV